MPTDNPHLITALLCAVGATLAYTAMQIAFKRAGSGDSKVQLNALGLTAWLGLLTPAWLALLLGGLASHTLTVNLSTTYFAWAGLWAVLSNASLLLIIWLLQKLSLIEFTAYRRAFTLFAVMALDVLLLGVSFKLPTLACLALILAGSWWLTQSREQTGKATLPLPVILGSAAAVAIIMALQLYAYKQALNLQSDILTHVCIARAMAGVCSLLLFMHPATPKPTVGHVRASWLVPAAIMLYFLSAVSEAFAISELPLTLVSASAYVGAAILAAYDLKKGELPITEYSLAGLILIFGGFFIIVLQQLLNEYSLQYLIMLILD